MSEYVTTLKLADDLVDRVVKGTKRITIRLGQRNIEVGKFLTLEATNGTLPSVQVYVEGLTVLPLELIDETYIEADGYASHEDLIAGLQKFYPGINENSIVTLVMFTLI